jgi:hypothetical protein
MKTRNYMSIDFQNNYSIPKLTLMPLNYFFPHKTFSSGYNYNSKIINDYLCTRLSATTIKAASLTPKY